MLPLRGFQVVADMAFVTMPGRAKPSASK